MKKQMVLMLTGLGLFLASLFGFQAYKLLAIKKVMLGYASPAMTVSTIKALPQYWKPSLKAVGSLRAVQGVDVTTETAGIIQSIHFQAGEEVKQGADLIKLNADPELATLGSLKAAEELANINYSRDKEQFKSKTISQSTIDTDLANLKGAQAQVAAQLAIIAKKNITAPFSGRLGISTANVGQYLHAGDKIVTLQAIDPIYVDFYVPQKKLSELAVGQEVQIGTDSYPHDFFKGTLSVIDPKVDTDTRNVQVQATIANPHKKLLPGMFATVELSIEKQKLYLTVPQTAITYNPYGEIIYIVQKNENGELKAIQSFVKTGDTQGDQVAIIEGLKEGDTVVTSGQLKLKNGSLVIINNEVLPSNNPNPKLVNE